MADVIQKARKNSARGGMLADVCSTGTDGTVFVENKGKKVAGTTGLEPATSDVTGRTSPRDLLGMYLV